MLLPGTVTCTTDTRAGPIKTMGIPVGAATGIKVGDPTVVEAVEVAVAITMEAVADEEDIIKITTIIMVIKVTVINKATMVIILTIRMVEVNKDNLKESNRHLLSNNSRTTLE